MCWVQRGHFRHVSDPRPVQGCVLINLFRFLVHQTWKKKNVTSLAFCALVNVSCPKQICPQYNVLYVFAFTEASLSLSVYMYVCVCIYIYIYIYIYICLQLSDAVFSCTVCWYNLEHLGQGWPNSTHKESHNSLRTRLGPHVFIHMSKGGGRIVRSETLLPQRNMYYLLHGAESFLRN